MHEETKKPDTGFPGKNLIAAWAMVLYMPLRNKAGLRHFGICPLLGWALIFVWSSYTNSPSLMWMVPLTAIVWTGEVLSAAVRSMRGQIEHTGYGGFPYATYWLCRSEFVAKQIGEPLIVLGIGFLIFFFSPERECATFFWWGSFVMFMYNAMLINDERRVIEQIHNTRIENEYYLEQIRAGFALLKT